MLRSYGQDPQFSQFYAAPLYLSPSLAGVSEAPRLICNYRDQWPKLPGRFTTSAVSLDNFFDRYKSGLGAIIFYDRAGGNKLTNFKMGLNYSYRIEISRNFSILPGLGFYYDKRSINYNALTFSDQYQGTILLPTSIENLPNDYTGHVDFSSSVLAFGQKYWVGFTFDHMMKIAKSLKDNNSYAPIKLSVYGGYKFTIREAYLNRLEQSITVALQYQQQSQIQQMAMGIYYKQYPFMIGMWYRGLPVVSSNSNDAICFLAGLEFNRFTFTYSYDFTISSLITATGGANEIALIYKFRYIKDNRKRHLRSVPCPKF